MKNACHMLEWRSSITGKKEVSFQKLWKNVHGSQVYLMQKRRGQVRQPAVQHKSTDEVEKWPTVSLYLNELLG